MLGPVQTLCFCHVELLSILQLGSAKAQQKHNFDSDIIPELFQIQDLLKPCNKSPCTFPRKTTLIKYNINEFCLAWQKHDVWITAMSESCVAELTPYLLQNFDSDSMLLPYLINFLNLVWHGRCTRSELSLSLSVLKSLEKHHVQLHVIFNIS